MKEVEGDLIKLALEGKFDVIAHGCNCFCLQGAGIAKQMSKVFLTNVGDYNWYSLESNDYKGDVNKLGQIQDEKFFVYMNEHDHNIPYNHKVSIMQNYETAGKGCNHGGEIVNNLLYVVNAYTQYQPGANLDYVSLKMCMKKINYVFKGKHVGLPMIGCGIAGGDWEKVKGIIDKELVDCSVTIVKFNNNDNS